MGTAQAVSAFATAAIVFVVLLIAGSVVVSSLTTDALRPVRMSGHVVKRWSGYVLMAVGSWFLLLAVLPNPILGS